jgi:cephalosporin-C deacetylase-like acetyl esterase
MTRSDIEFKTIDHVTLRGWIFKPTDAQGKLPCLVMSHGLTCLKEMHLDTLAERLTSALPIACLVYDHRGFGSSDQKDNEPRNEVVPAYQNSDLQDAITYAQSREDIDAAKIGLWGYSYSGGHSLWVGAIDRRVKAVIAVAPFTNGEVISNNTRSDFEDALDEMLAQGMIDRLNQASLTDPLQNDFLEQPATSLGEYPSLYRIQWTLPYYPTRKVMPSSLPGQRRLDGRTK